MNPVPVFRRRCRRCGRWLTKAYAARGTGRVCGGPIKKTRRPALPETDDRRHRNVPVLPGQLDLFAELEVTL